MVVGPEREHAVLDPSEVLSWDEILEANTYKELRIMVSDALAYIHRPQNGYVLDGFQRHMRRAWRVTAGA
jgi:hypothetical protein